MNSNPLFNAVIIDTNAFDSKYNDFCGYFNSIIPSFFKSLSEQNIKIISHPVLIGETKKHIQFGVGGKTLNQKVTNTINALTRNKEILKLVSFDYNDILAKLEQLDLEKNNLQAVERLFSKAEMLSYSDPAIIFDKYFKNEPPFSESGDKKSEFPDAFIIESIMDYLKGHSTDSLLIISNDNDWTKSFYGKDKISMVDNIDDALKLLNNQEKNINYIIETLYQDIKDYFAENTTTETWFDIHNYELESDIDIEEVKLDDISDNYVPLVISENKIVLQITVKLLVDGATTIFDYDNSVWDSEIRTYILTSFAVLDFQQASGEVTCEIHISLDDNKEPNLERIKIIAPHGITLSLNEENMDISEITFDLDVKSDMQDTAEDYYNH